jgi:hypothetical protein
MVDQKISDLVAVTTAPDTYLFELANPGVTNVKITVANFIAQIAALSTGDVVGPASATDNAVTRFDGTTGKLIQNSVATIADDGSLALGSTPVYSSARKIKVHDDGVNGAARVSLIATEGTALGPALEMAYGSTALKRGLIRLDDEGANDYGLTFFTTNSNFVAAGMTLSGNKHLSVVGDISGANLQVNASDSTKITQIIKAAASQTANLTEWQNSAGTILALVNPNGDISSSGSMQLGSTLTSSHEILTFTYTPNSVYKNYIAASHGGSAGQNSIEFFIKDGALASYSSALKLADNFITLNKIPNFTTDVGIGTTAPRTSLETRRTGLSNETHIIMSNSDANYKHEFSNTYSSTAAVANNMKIKVASGSGTQATPLTLYGDGSIGVENLISTATGIKVKAAASQTANLTEWQDSAGAVLALVNPNGDIEITDSTKGLILESPDSTRWRITIDNAGALTATSL